MNASSNIDQFSNTVTFLDSNNNYNDFSSTSKYLSECDYLNLTNHDVKEIHHHSDNSSEYDFDESDFDDDKSGNKTSNKTSGSKYIVYILTLKVHWSN